MKKISFHTVLSLILLCGSSSSAQQLDLSGDWVVVLTAFDATDYRRWHLEHSADGSLSGRSGDITLSGTAGNGRIVVEQRNAAGKSGQTFAGSISSTDRLTGRIRWRGGIEWTWTAHRLPDSKTYQPRVHDLRPERFHVTFSGTTEPALRVRPRDVIRTSLIDAEGMDASRTRRSFNGMLTGPIYVDGAVPGDGLVVRLTRVRANRDSGGTHGLFHPATVSPEFYDQMSKESPWVAWTIDRGRSVVRVENPSERLKGVELPLRPMIGMIGVAPPGDIAAEPNTLGPWGGNLDYNRVEEGVTLFFPVFQLGALLFLGDGHAAQGDGEISGAGIETSLDVEMTVDVIRGRSPSGPRIETSEELIALGIGGSLDSALTDATTQLARWLEQEHGLLSTDAALLLGQAIRYDIAEVVGRSRVIGAAVKKELLRR